MAPRTGFSDYGLVRLRLCFGLRSFSSTTISFKLHSPILLRPLVKKRKTWLRLAFHHGRIDARSWSDAASSQKTGSPRQTQPMQADRNRLALRSILYAGSLDTDPGRGKEMLDACVREGFFYVDLGANELSIRQTLIYARIFLTPRDFHELCSERKSWLEVAETDDDG